MRYGLSATLIVAAVMFSPPALVAGQETAPSQETVPSDDQVNSVAADLYCPVCPNTPLDVCETLACKEWREQIRDQIAAGWTNEEIAEYFAQQYGDRVLAKPRRSGFTLMLWILPLLGSGFGLVALGQVMRRWRRHQHRAPVPPPEDGEVPAELRQRIEKELRNLS